MTGTSLRSPRFVLPLSCWSFRSGGISSGSRGTGCAICHAASQI